MPETVSAGRPPVANGAATVSASALALHLDCSRTHIVKLEAEGVIQRQGDGFPLDQSCVAYLRYLRRERRQSPRVEADAERVKVKTEMLRLRLMETRLGRKGRCLLWTCPRPRDNVAGTLTQGRRDQPNSDSQE
jgi:hypothetical protein